tara:strand:+ start:596 stop:787 length:192 start_codon:yes stop_codon:yes gene_type:complete
MKLRLTANLLPHKMSAYEAFKAEIGMPESEFLGADPDPKKSRSIVKDTINFSRPHGDTFCQVN